MENDTQFIVVKNELNNEVNIHNKTIYCAKY